LTPTPPSPARLTAVPLLNATPFQLGLLVAIQNGAFLMIGLPAGVWLDRRRVTRS
jgi:hypothetical protein